jgi:hypothetical protein
MEWATGMWGVYVGREAAESDVFVQDVYNNLKRQWAEKPKGVGFLGGM